MDKIGGGILAIISAVVGLAVIAVIVSKNANTPTVISSAGSALSNVIGAAVAPVTGSGSGLSNLFGSVSSNGSFGGWLGSLP
jgi:PRD1 phage membrane DNA delivery